MEPCGCGGGSNVKRLTQRKRRKKQILKNKLLKFLGKDFLMMIAIELLVDIDSI